MTSNKFPLIVNLKPNSLDDGPGIRSVIFFKGCPLSCVWCQNPETQDPYPELVFQPDNCIQCQPCTIKCPNQAFEFADPLRLDRSLCQKSFHCVDQCPAEVVRKAGEYYDIRELVDKFKSYKVFYDNTGGGVTFSGGEPLMFPKFIKELVLKLKAVNINTLVETCGFFKIDENLEQILQNVDIIYYDIKILDSKQHREYCGVNNQLILTNFHKLVQDFRLLLPENAHALDFKENSYEKALLIPRIPLIPDITMTTDNLEQIAEFLQQNQVKVTDLLPYNPLWIEKSKTLRLKLKYSRKEWIQESALEDIREIFSEFELISFK